MTTTPITTNQVQRLAELTAKGMDGILAERTWERLANIIEDANIADETFQGLMLHTAAQWFQCHLFDAEPTRYQQAFLLVCENLHAEFGLEKEYGQAEMVFNELLNEEAAAAKEEGYAVDNVHILNAGNHIMHERRARPRPQCAARLSPPITRDR